MRATLSACPQRRYNDPAYPTKLVVLATPELLSCHQPAAWLTNRELATAAGAFLAAGLAFGAEPPPASQPATRPVKIAADAPAIAAPIFEHGNGRASFGCIVVNPPHMLKEDDAMRIISDELKAGGVKLMRRNINLNHLELPKPPQVVSDRQQGYRFEETGAAPLRVDGLDLRHRVAVEFISGRDLNDIGGPWQREVRTSTVSTRDLHAAAEFVSQQANGQPAGVYLGVFYDPAEGVERTRGPTEAEQAELNQAAESGDAAKYDQLRRELREREQERREAAYHEAQQRSERLLREQVKDFIEWLEAQGVI